MKTYQRFYLVLCLGVLFFFMACGSDHHKSSGSRTGKEPNLHQLNQGQTQDYCACKFPKYVVSEEVVSALRENGYYPLGDFNLLVADKEKYCKNDDFFGWEDLWLVSFGPYEPSSYTMNQRFSLNTISPKTKNFGFILVKKSLSKGERTVISRKLGLAETVLEENLELLTVDMVKGLVTKDNPKLTLSRPLESEINGNISVSWLVNNKAAAEIYDYNDKDGQYILGLSMTLELPSSRSKTQISQEIPLALKYNGNLAKVIEAPKTLPNGYIAAKVQRVSFGEVRSSFDFKIEEPSTMVYAKAERKYLKPADELTDLERIQPDAINLKTWGDDSRIYLTKSTIPSGDGQALVASALRDCLQEDNLDLNSVTIAAGKKTLGSVEWNILDYDKKADLEIIKTSDRIEYRSLFNHCRSYWQPSADQKSIIQFVMSSSVPLDSDEELDIDLIKDALASDQYWLKFVADTEQTVSSFHLKN